MQNNRISLEERKTFFTKNAWKIKRVLSNAFAEQKEEVPAEEKTVESEPVLVEIVEKEIHMEELIRGELDEEDDEDFELD